MKKGRTAAVLGFAGALAIVVATAAVTWRPLLARWFLAELESPDPVRRMSAADWLGALRWERAAPALFGAVASERIPEDAGTVALCRIGQPAVPAIIEGLRDGRRQVRKVATESLLAIEPEQHREIAADLRRLLHPREQLSAIQALAGRFPHSEAAISALIGQVMDPRAGEWAAMSLGEIGPGAAAALPYLIGVLKSRLPHGGQAALAMVEIGYPDPQKLMPPLMEALTDRAWTARSIGFCASSPTSRQLVIGALERLGPAAKDAVPALLRVLTDSEEARSHRQAAARALVVIAPGDRRLIGPFFDTVRSEGGELFDHCPRQPFSNFGKEAVRPLIDTLHHGNEAARRLALGSLGQIGLRAAEAVPAILALVDGASNSERDAAIEALGSIPTPEAVSRLRALRNGGDPEDADRASRALGDTSHLTLQQVAGIERRTLPQLLEGLRDPKGWTLWTDLEALGDLGVEAREATPVLLDLLKERRESVLVARILETVGRIGEPRDQVLSILGAASLSRDLPIAMKASYRLWKMGETSTAHFLHFLQSAMKYGGLGVFPLERREAADHLAELGPEARSALPAIRRALRDPDPELRSRAAFVLWIIEGDAVLGEVSETMIDAMADRHSYELRYQDREGVGDCLSRIGPKALPLILPRLDDEDEYVRMGLLYALEKLGPAASAARPALEARLDDPHFRVRELAARALKAIDP